MLLALVDAYEAEMLTALNKARLAKCATITDEDIYIEDVRHAVYEAILRGESSCSVCTTRRCGDPLMSVVRNLGYKVNISKVDGDTVYLDINWDNITPLTYDIKIM